MIETNSAIKLACIFHDIYEKLAPRFGYVTREETRVFNASTQNGRLMIAVCREFLDSLPDAPCEGEKEKK